jgi:hypothetical protein
MFEYLKAYLEFFTLTKSWWIGAMCFVHCKHTLFYGLFPRLNIFHTRYIYANPLDIINFLAHRIIEYGMGS